MNQVVGVSYLNRIEYTVTPKQERTPEYYDDVHAMEAFPKAEWDEEHHKYRLTFHCADFGGYDVCSMEFYFDTWGELRRWVLNQLKR